METKIFDNGKILFIHGFMGSRRDWHWLLDKQLAGRACYALDLPGHGDNIQASSNYTFETCALAIHDWLDHNKFLPCSLVGYSMGGRLALYLAAKFPRSFQKLVLESSSPGLSSAEERLTRRISDQKLALRINSSSLQEFYKFWYANPLFGALQKHPEYSTLLERRLQNDRGALAASLLRLSTGNQPSLWEVLPKIQNEVLLLSGKEDEKYTHIMQRMARLLPKSQHEIVQNAAHNVHFENKQTYTEKLTDFFNEV